MEELADVKVKLEETEDLLVELQEENEMLTKKIAEGGGGGGGKDSAKLAADLAAERAKIEQLTVEYTEMEAMLAEEMEKTEALAAEKAKLELKIERLTKAGAGRGVPAAPAVAGRGKAE